MSLEFAEPPGTVEILARPDGTQVVEICNTCLMENGADENCQPSALYYVQELRRAGHVAEVRDPGEVAFP